MSSHKSTDGIGQPVEALLLKDAALLLEQDYLPFEAGYTINSDGMQHIAASTYMKDCTGAMIDWWFGWMHTTDQYLLWHPRDHVSSDWLGPRNNDSTYIGGHHIVTEYIGTDLQKLKISFLDPANYFGADWKQKFKSANYSTAVCGRVGICTPEGTYVYSGHLIHLIKNEADGCRMRSRFWLGDVEGVTDAQQRAVAVPPGFARGLCQHATEEMAILATILPGLYEKYSKASGAL